MRIRSNFSTFSQELSKSYPPTMGWYDYGALTYGNSRMSSIEDDVSSPTSRHNKVCLHVKKTASIVSGTFPFNFVNVWTNLVEGTGYLTARLSVIPNVELSPPSDVDWAGMTSSLCGQAKGQIQTKSQLLVTIAAAAKTYGMVTNPFNLLKTDWRNLASGLTASSLAKKASGLWLEGRYGWNSAFVDVKNFCSSIKKLRSSYGDPESSKIGARLRSTRVSSGDGPYKLLHSQSTQDYCFRKDGSLYYRDANYSLGGSVFTQIQGTGQRDFCSVFCKRLDPVTGSFNALEKTIQAFGCTASDLLPTIWELVPYSFVVDWFVNSKGLFNYPNRSYLQTARLENLGYSIKSTWGFKAMIAPLIDAPWYWYKYEAGGPTQAVGDAGEITRYQRSTGLPEEQSVLLNLGLSSTHLADSVGLIIQKLLK